LEGGCGGFGDVHGLDKGRGFGIGFGVGLFRRMVNDVFEDVDFGCLGSFWFFG
jgi:hypothetical protein